MILILLVVVFNLHSFRYNTVLLLWRLNEQVRRLTGASNGRHSRGHHQHPCQDSPTQDTVLRLLTFSTTAVVNTKFALNPQKARRWQNKGN